MHRVDRSNRKYETHTDTRRAHRGRNSAHKYRSRHGRGQSKGTGGRASRRRGIQRAKRMADRFVSKTTAARQDVSPKADTSAVSRSYRRGG